ncbi:MAG TPA: hypothetical protein V6C78_15115 [Crinalium sp.]|jgi:hypothetical protein
MLPMSRVPTPCPEEPQSPAVLVADSLFSLDVVSSCHVCTMGLTGYNQSLRCGLLNVGMQPVNLPLGLSVEAIAKGF